MKGSVFLKLDGKRVGFAFTGSFCTFKKVIEELKNVKGIGDAKYEDLKDSVVI